MKKNIILIFILFLIFNIQHSTFNIANAQCAMCKAVVETNMDGQTNKVGMGLNSGILYLMALPYLILGSMFFFFFKKQIMEKVKSIIHQK